MRGMGHDLHEITEEALRLPPEDRVFLAESLLLTIDESSEPKMDAATVAKLEGRLSDLRAGKVIGIPTEQALRQAREVIRPA